MVIKIAPSLLAADFSRLGEEIREIEEAGADLLHIDVMDGHFVPNITIGVPVVASLKGLTRLPLDVHLMIDNPRQFVEPFARAGADIITFHIEVTSEPKEIIKAIRGYGVKAGLVLNPPTPLSKVEPVLNGLDMVLLMTVNPGFGGQEFIPEVIPKIRELRKIREERKLHLDIEVDGGINSETARQVISAGANVLVAGMAIFAERDRKSSLRALRA
ncbi:ribulose-phosphate 3-epimerase [candidate division NPL-UPA2 bacterium]|nr:ribulose-phosphate 3-epimerase [candidate division NPL-UPA2 bacterium]